MSFRKSLWSLLTLLHSHHSKLHRIDEAVEVLRHSLVVGMVEWQRLVQIDGLLSLQDPHDTPPKDVGRIGFPYTEAC